MIVKTYKNCCDDNDKGKVREIAYEDILLIDSKGCSDAVWITLRSGEELELSESEEGFRLRMDEEYWSKIAHVKPCGTNIVVETKSGEIMLKPSDIKRVEPFDKKRSKVIFEGKKKALITDSTPIGIAKAMKEVRAKLHATQLEIETARAGAGTIALDHRGQVSIKELAERSYKVNKIDEGFYDWERRGSPGGGGIEYG